MDVWSSKCIAQDLQMYIKIIERLNVSSLFDFAPLHGVIDGLIRVEHCRIENIQLEFYHRKPISKITPEVKSFKINLMHSVISTPGVDATVSDPIDSFSFDLVVTGFCAEGKEYLNCWHLDKDIRMDADGNNNGEAKYTHPLYHFQFGGKQLDSKSVGDLMLMPTPRIPHPPMDIFLAIHFVFNNYFNKKESDFSCLEDLYQDIDYQDILNRAKERMWYPYFKGLNPMGRFNQDLNLANLFPLAV